MWTSLLFTLYFILLVLFVCACAINSQRIKHKLRIHPRIASLMFPFFINVSFYLFSSSPLKLSSKMFILSFPL